MAMTLLSFPARAAATVCILIADADTADILLDEGDCRSRTTPASTFKVPVAVMPVTRGF
ncbi:hypothetical protein [Primorskyibacter sp. 2E107]|uniref:hypothetical protein n=1 Tax=Primorskyibacter sp. 2E107 TaxID=3403458 RepID=UPI003AF9FAE1